MPKNTQGGKKYKQQKHKNNNAGQITALQKPTEGQTYSTVTKLEIVELLKIFMTQEIQR